MRKKVVHVSSYYNEIDPFKAEVLREAIRAGAIAPGVVDERSIVDVKPADLMGYAQCHFFAGGGFWSVALRQAGWSDDWPVWSGSCPCPSFSAAGKGQGFTDPRHLWPAWARLIRECHPSTIFGEQVSAAIGHGWLDLVQTDLEAQNYAVGKIVLGAASVGAPHIRQRLYFVAQSGCVPERWRVCGPGESGVAARTGAPGQLVGSSANYALANTADARRQAAGQHGSGQPLFPARPEQRGDSLVVAKPDCGRCGTNGERNGLAEVRTSGPNQRVQIAQSSVHGVLVDAEGRGLGMCGSAQGKARHTAQPSESGDLGNSTFDRNGTQHGESRPSRGQEEPSGGPSVSVSLGEPIRTRLEGHAGNGTDGNQPRRFEENALGSGAITSILGGMADSLYPEWRPFGVDGSDGRNGNDAGRQETHSEFGTCSEVRGASPLNGFWRDADWIGCRDGKFRPVPGTTKSGPLSVVDGDSADLGYFLLPGGRGFAFSPLIEKGKERVGRLRLYGDAICIPAAQAFIEAYLEAKSAKKQG